MRILGYQQEQANHTMFIKQTKNGRKSILIVYVDSMILTGDDAIGIQQLREYLQAEFKVKDLRTLKYFHGMEVVRSKRGIFTIQRKYTLDLLTKTGKIGCKLASTHLEQNWNSRSTKTNHLVDKARYQSLVGKLIHLSLTRPDIAFSVSVVSQFMYAPI